MNQLINQQGLIKFNEPLARYTSWHVGGKATCLYKPAHLADLQNFIKNLPPEEQVIWLGLGSNVLIRDGGIQGVVVITQNRLNELERLPDGRIRAEAGVTCAKMAKFCSKAGLKGAAFFAGVPGTIGGALRMNAGAFGGETWEHVAMVETMDRQGNVHYREPREFKISYRTVVPFSSSPEWFIAGYFQYPEGDAEKEQQAIRELLKKRSATQPIGEFNCGSVFRNPPGDFAARLIEACGLKGLRKGGAWVSEKHANFITNGGEATAAEIEALINEIRETVQTRFGILLQAEVHIIGVGADPGVCP